MFGKEGIIPKLTKALIERMLNAEKEYHLSNSEEGRAVGNTRNGHGKKTVQGKFGQLELITKIALLEDAILSLYTLKG